MCGIIGIVGRAPVAPLLVDGLRRLEYRGYDSAGIATLTNGTISRRRAQGKLANLEALLRVWPMPMWPSTGSTRSSASRLASLPWARRREIVPSVNVAIPAES